jgi:hypothetical protein
VNIRRGPGRHLHHADFATQVNLLDDLVQLKVTDKQAVDFADVADVRCQVVVQETCFCLVVSKDFIVYKGSLGHAVVVVERVNSFGFGEAIVYVLLKVKTVHEDELGR